MLTVLTLSDMLTAMCPMVSPWARRFLPRKGGAELESARGLQATLAVLQRPGRRNPRSSVATVTELDPLLRLLFARAGERPCPGCGNPVHGDRCACGGILPTLWAADFSPNSERGACRECKGLGFLQRCDPDRLVTDPDRALEDGAMDGTRFGAYLGERDGQFVATLRQAAAQAGLDLNQPWRKLGLAERQLAMSGSGEILHEVAWRYRRGKVEGTHALRTVWAGFANLVDREYERVHGDLKGEALEPLLTDRSCPECGGERLQATSRNVRFGDLRLPEVLALSIVAARGWVDAMATGLSHRVLALTENLRGEIAGRLHALAEAGLGYLALQREMASLSGGEAQRVRLAAALGGGLVGVTYVLDEPTQGLHAKDVERLGSVLRDLANAGNAVVVVEHDRSLIASAQQIVELGPGAGPEGGRLVAIGTPDELKRIPTSRTGDQLRRAHTLPRGEPKAGRAPGIQVRGAYLHNLQNIDVTFPAGALVTVTGVSGSGKSSLVLEVLGGSLRNHLQGRGPSGCDGIDLGTDLHEVISADQGPLGMAWNSTVLSLVGLGETLRKRFAATPRAKELKLSARSFSTAAPGGRCEACEGRGVLVVAMDLLADVTVGCETCQGRRFKPEVLDCLLDGHSITDLLDASVAELAATFAQDTRMRRPMQALCDLGLGYLRLGQEGSSLSEGERQRLRLAGLIAEAPSARTAILLDEPTRGLGFEDVNRLLATLRELAKAGHLVVAVEHDLDFIAGSDWVIDLGPDGGKGGGRVLVEGPPEAVVACAASYTGQALASR